MNIKDGLKLKGRPAEIPDCGRNDLAKFFAEQGYKVGVEIGVDVGDYTKVLCGEGLKVYAVDPWENYDEYKRPGKYVSYYDKAVKNLEGLNCEIIKKYSMDAVKDFEDESLDFVYIDGNHTLPYATQDIFFWSRKVRKGGVVSGHDYATIAGYGERLDPPIWDGCHVKEAVDACANTMKIKKYYVLGERFSPNRDKWRSWLLIKE